MRFCFNLLIPLVTCAFIGSSLQAGTIRLSPDEMTPSPDAKCYCNLRIFFKELLRIYDSKTMTMSEQARGFTDHMTSMHFQLTEYFERFRLCVDFWRKSSNSFSTKCSCEPNKVCTKSALIVPMLNNFKTLVSHTRKTLLDPSIKQAPYLKQYRALALGINSQFSSNFNHFIEKLLGHVSDIRVETNDFIEMYSLFLSAKRNSNGNSFLDDVFSLTLSRDANSSVNISIIEQHAKVLDCHNSELLPLYLNIYSVVVQYLFMNELFADVSPGKVKKFDEAPWRKNFTNLLDDLSRHLVQCHTKERLIIHSQEVQEKDMALRNAAVVFSSFMLVLILIIVLITLLMCRQQRSNDRQTHIRVHESKIVSSDDESGQDAYTRRFYEMEDLL